MDGNTRAVEIRTVSGKNNQPIIRLFPLEINENRDQDEQLPETTSTDAIDKVTQIPYQRSIPGRKATIAACRKLKEWTDMLRAALEYVTDS